jgi:hypothetical protein
MVELSVAMRRQGQDRSQYLREEAKQQIQMTVSALSTESKIIVPEVVKERAIELHSRWHENPSWGNGSNLQSNLEARNLACIRRAMLEARLPVAINTLVPHGPEFYSGDSQRRRGELGRAYIRLIADLKLGTLIVQPKEYLKMVAPKLGIPAPIEAKIGHILDLIDNTSAVSGMLPLNCKPVLTAAGVTYLVCKDSYQPVSTVAVSRAFDIATASLRSWIQTFGKRYEIVKNMP